MLNVMAKGQVDQFGEGKELQPKPTQINGTIVWLKPF
jgi:hypothetical protein